MSKILHILRLGLLALVLFVIGTLPTHAYSMQAEVSAYSTTGTMANGEWTHDGAVAADHLPFGTKVLINGRVYTVKDRFGGGYSNAFDIWMPSYDEAIEFGRQYITVEVLV